MKRVMWALGGVFSLVVSFVINFNSKSIYEFVIKSVILALFLFWALSLIVKLIENIKNKNSKKIRNLIITLMCVVILFFGLILIFIIFFDSGICLTAITPDHFRTNIFTGKCEFGGYNPCVSSDEWYYRVGCNSVEEKIEILKKEGIYDQKIESCKKFCQEEKYSPFYCSDSFSFVRGGGISCSDLFPCENISCS